MTNTAEYFNTLIGEFVNVEKTGATLQSVQLIFAMIVAILTTILKGDPKTVYKNNPEILKRRRIEFDFIVVGSGAGGSVVAARLSELRDRTTLILEGGCDDPGLYSEVPPLYPALLRSKQDWNYSSKDKNTCTGMIGGCYVPRGKMFCGCPAMNVMLHVRGSYHTYDVWEKKYGCVGWGSRHVLKYFRKSEGNTDHSLNRKYHCSKGPLKVSYYNKDPYEDFIMKGINEAGFPTVRDINVPHGPCVARVQGTLYNGRRYAVCKAFINLIQCRNNFKILKCALVTRVIFKGRTAIGVEFYHKGARYVAYARKEVVLCAGAIGTPLILQQSGIGLQEDLNHGKIKSWLNLPVGRYLQDHFGVWLWFSFCGDPSTIGQLFSSITGYFNCPRTGDFAGIGTLPIIAFLNIGRDARPNIECYFLLFTVKSLNLPNILNILQYKPEIANKILQTNQEKMVLMTIPSLLTPKSRGIVRLDGANCTDTFNNPYILFKYLSDCHGYDRKSFVKAMQLLLTFRNSPTWNAACAEFILLPVCQQFEDVTSDEYCNCYIEPMGGSVYHPVGTCRMGRSPQKHKIAKSVVNPQCQVHGTEHLRVADASIMPVITSGNTNVPTVMIGEKCADMIKEAHGVRTKSPKCQRYKGDCACKFNSRKSCCSCSPKCRQSSHHKCKQKHKHKSSSRSYFSFSLSSCSSSSCSTSSTSSSKRYSSHSKTSCNSSIFI